jgi:hypothetical protein
MYVRRWDRSTRLLLVAGVAAIGLTALFLMPRLPLSENYHLFADNRRILGLPNCFDVLSNIPFMISGTLGLLWLSRRASKRSLSCKGKGCRISFFLPVWR